MPFGVELYFDPAAETRVRRLWSALADAGLCSLMPELGARPHLSLALYDTIDAPALEGVLDDFAHLIRMGLIEFRPVRQVHEVALRELSPARRDAPGD